MDEAVGLLETSTGLGVLSVLFLLAGLYSWWTEHRARRARRRKLLATLGARGRRREADLAERSDGQEIATTDEPGTLRNEPLASPCEASIGEATVGAAEASEPSAPAEEASSGSVGEAAGSEREAELEEIAAPLERAELADEHECAQVVIGALDLSADDAEEITADFQQEQETSSRERSIPEPESPCDGAPLDRLDDLIERGELTEARSLLAELAKHAPQDLRLRGRAGRLALRGGRPEAAVRLLERCIEREPDDLESRLDLCEAHAELGRFEDVVRHARRGLERSPGQGGLLVHLSEAAFELGAPDEALELAADAFRALPKTHSFFHLARLLAMTHRLAESDANRLRRALERYPGEPALLHAAGVYEALYGNRASALDILRSAASKPQGARHRRAIERELAALEAVEPHAA